MSINKDFEDFFQCLNNNDVEYLIIGGYAHIYYTEPRYTKDLDILVNHTKENSARVYKGICEFFDKNIEGIEPDSFIKRNKPGEIICGFGNTPNSIEIFTYIPGIEFYTAWKEKESFKYGSILVWVISRKWLLKNFEEVRKISPELNRKYGYFIDELKKWD